MTTPQVAIPEAGTSTIAPVSLRQALTDYGNALDSLDVATGLVDTATDAAGDAHAEADRARQVLKTKLA